ncbi:MAG: DegQ family serine endoprotease [Rhodospirillales bacterium]|nr:DegQ family serine endoprotease [Rhodospirillales bacterium]
MVGAAVATPILASPSVEARDASDKLAGMSFADVIEEASPAVVRIAATRSHPQGSATGEPQFQVPEQFRDGPLGEFFDRFFREQPPGLPGDRGGTLPHAAATGSGFIVDEDGIVVTNNHVIRNADNLKITLKDGRTFDAEVVGVDEKTDLAVLRLESDDALPVVKWGDSDATRVGDWVVAVGNPFGLDGTVTAGIVSARGRDLGAGPYDDFIQIDASINQGNSGGPLFDGSGKVIGVNTAIYTPNGGNVGIGFAIPSNIAADVVAELQEKGVVERGFLGVMIQPVTDEIADSLGLDSSSGALVAEVTADSAAAKAGIQRGDVILRFDGKAIEGPRDLSRTVAESGIGVEKQLELWRDGKDMTLAVTLGEAPKQIASSASGASETQALDELGFAIAPLDAQARSRLELDEGVSGVVIVDVDGAKQAGQKGLRPGDVITSVDKQPVSRPIDVVNAIAAAKNSDKKAVLFLVERQGDSRFVALSLTDA